MDCDQRGFPFRETMPPLLFSKRHTLEHVNNDNNVNNVNNDINVNNVNNDISLKNKQQLLAHSERLQMTHLNSIQQQLIQQQLLEK